MSMRREFILDFGLHVAPLKSLLCLELSDWHHTFHMFIAGHSEMRASIDSIQYHYTTLPPATARSHIMGSSPSATLTSSDGHAIGLLEQLDDRPQVPNSPPGSNTSSTPPQTTQKDILLAARCSRGTRATRAAEAVRPSTRRPNRRVVSLHRKAARSHRYCLSRGS